MKTVEFKVRDLLQERKAVIDRAFDRLKADNNLEEYDRIKLTPVKVEKTIMDWIQMALRDFQRENNYNEPKELRVSTEVYNELNRVSELITDSGEEWKDMTNTLMKWNIDVIRDDEIAGFKFV